MIQTADSMAASLIEITWAVLCTARRSKISIAVIAPIRATQAHTGTSKLAKLDDELSAARKWDVSGAGNADPGRGYRPPSVVSPGPGYPPAAVQYHPLMAVLTNAAVERLLLLMADYGRVVAASMREVSPDPELVSMGSLIVLCTLDLDGPSRPGVLQDVTGLSSGGVSKLLDRMEQAGVVKRTYGGVPGDNRGVVVSITRRGRALTSRVSGAVASRLPESGSLVKAIAAVVEE